MTASSKFKVMRWVAFTVFIAPILAVGISRAWALSGESISGSWLILSVFGALLWKLEKILRDNRMERILARHRGDHYRL